MPRTAGPSCYSPRALVPAPVGAAAHQVRAWFDGAVRASAPVVDGTLASERDAADTYRRMGKAENTHRAAVRAGAPGTASLPWPPSSPASAAASCGPRR